jgi:methyltransferase (TIGR00027 family)
VIAREPSHTAQGAAIHRAVHQLLDTPRVFADPLALRIIGPVAEEALRTGRDRRLHPTAAPLRAFIAVRSRYAEDRFADSGLLQYVVLGAGLDTFAYRSSARVFEVDHPATQLWKRARLTEVGIAIPESVTYAAVDFEHETLADGLAHAGLDRDEPAFFAWLGVTPYLTRDAIFETLRVVSATVGNEVVFDFATPSTDEKRAALAARVAAAGEPFLSEFAPDALVTELCASGFSRMTLEDHVSLNARYGLSSTGGHLVHAIV